MLRNVGRSPMRASHLHFMVPGEGMHTLVTHSFVRGDQLLRRDTVFDVVLPPAKDNPDPDAPVVARLMTD